MLQRRRFILLVCCLFGASTIFMSEAYASDGVRQYVNSEYGFSVKMPLGQPTCRAQPGTHNTGIIIFLDRGLSNCVKSDQRPFIAVNGTYNATGAQSPFKALLILCGSSKPQSTDPALFDNLKKHWPAMCRIEQEDGFVEYVLVHQSRTLAADAAPRINYTLVIHVLKNSLSRELKDSKHILQSVHMWK
jgi:hypothetical protein